MNIVLKQLDKNNLIKSDILIKCIKLDKKIY